MAQRGKPQVIVVGAGPVGLFAALALARRGVRVSIVDEHWKHHPQTHVSHALHPSSLELLAELDVAKGTIEHALRVDNVAVYDHGERTAEVAISSLSTAYPFVGFLPERVLEDALVHALEREKVHVEWNHRLRSLSDHVSNVGVTIDTLTTEPAGYAIAQSEVVIDETRDFAPAFVLGADGHDSRARAQLEVDFEAILPSERTAVFEVDVERPLPPEVRILLGDETCDVVWPLPGNGCRWLFQLTGADAAMGEPSDPLALLQRLIRERAPWFTGGTRSIRWSEIVDCEHQLASTFGKGHVWLAGDAAHTTDWGGAQSMNVGMREAVELAGIYADSIKGGASERALDAYDHERRSAWLRYFGTDEHGAIAKPSAPSWATTHAARVARSLPASGDHLARLLEPLAIRFGA